MKFEQTKSLFSPRDNVCESGIDRLKNGVLHLSVLTRMPNVTSEMIAWWFGEYMQTTEHYRRWHPRDHVWMDWADKKKGTHLGAKHLVHEYVGGQLYKLKIHFIPPNEFFDDEVTPDGNSLLLCAKLTFMNIPIETTRFVHAVRNVPGGCEMRSNFWLGYINSPILLVNPVGNRWLTRKLLATYNLGRKIEVHCHEEMTNLAGFLPSLFAQEA
jgi:DAPG hydrolase PhiG domain